MMAGLLLAEAIVERIKPTLSTYLSDYLTEPAVFDAELAPQDADFPFCLVTGPIANSPDNTKTSRGRNTFYDIRLWAKDEGDRHDLKEAIEKVRYLFDQRNAGLIVEGTTVSETNVTGPTALPSGDEVQGMGITIEVINEEG